MLPCPMIPPLLPNRPCRDRHSLLPPLPSLLSTAPKSDFRLLCFQSFAHSSALMRGWGAVGVPQIQHSSSSEFLSALSGSIGGLLATSHSSLPCFYLLSFHTLANSSAPVTHSTPLFSRDSTLLAKNTRVGILSSFVRASDPQHRSPIPNLRHDSQFLHQPPSASNQSLLTVLAIHSTYGYVAAAFTLDWKR
jgi:hypothetical protein